jgi:hypothetical protein
MNDKFRKRVAQLRTGSTVLGLKVWSTTDGYQYRKLTIELRRMTVNDMASDVKHFYREDADGRGGKRLAAIAAVTGRTQYLSSLYSRSDGTLTFKWQADRENDQRLGLDFSMPNSPHRWYGFDCEWQMSTTMLPVVTKITRWVDGRDKDPRDLVQYLMDEHGAMPIEYHQDPLNECLPDMDFELDAVLPAIPPKVEVVEAPSWTSVDTSVESGEAVSA